MSRSSTQHLTTTTFCLLRLQPTVRLPSDDDEEAIADDCDLEGF
jgi:hypothetical protein